MRLLAFVIASLVLCDSVGLFAFVFLCVFLGSSVAFAFLCLLVRVCEFLCVSMFACLCVSLRFFACVLA